ncbi:MAG: UDP-3-O-(3-hydroxymyristoyl)glucosamine N-acyltransferase [Planctomycetes bacterium]|nr:UDP-3-O-(3-hydroxymyristoyl)glucosamine N-acyltransferase [Planctomycetota bacterium]
MILSADALATTLNAEVLGSRAATARGVESVERARPDQLTFVRDARNWEKWTSRGAAAAGIVLAPVSLKDEIIKVSLAPGIAVLLVADADLAMMTVLGLMESAQKLPRPGPGVHPSAMVHPSAQVDPSAIIGPECTIGPDAKIGAEVLIKERCSVGASCTIGDCSTLHPGVVLYAHTQVGQRVIVHANAVLGSDGFGYRFDPAKGGLAKIPHVGNVMIGDDVEIGANTCIDRAKFGSTRIGDGTKIDNLVQIGHGCQIGRSVVICGQVGLAGSVTIGDGVMLGGQVGVADQRQIGSGAMVAAQSGVESDIPPKSRVIGSPAEDMKVSIGKLHMLNKLLAHRSAVAKLFKSLGE